MLLNAFINFFGIFVCFSSLKLVFLSFPFLLLIKFVSKKKPSIDSTLANLRKFDEGTQEIAGLMTSLSEWCL